MAFLPTSSVGTTRNEEGRRLRRMTASQRTTFVAVAVVAPALVAVHAKPQHVVAKSD